MPDLLLIDGGPGQLAQAVEVLTRLGVGDLVRGRRRERRRPPGRAGAPVLCRSGERRLSSPPTRRLCS